MKSQPTQPSTANRRDFLKSTAAATVAGSTLSAISARAYAEGSDVLKVGLIGCGGRGTGAARQALMADKNVKLTAMADAFEDRLQGSLNVLKRREELKDKLDVPAERMFVGFNAYQQVIDSGVDVVLLATPPHFRPIHLKAAIDAGIHVFAEKPVAVDAPGVRSVLATCREAAQKKLSVVSGLCLRYSNQFKDTVGRIHDGEIGEVTTLFANDYRGGIWVKPRQADWTDMHYQMRNWYYFTWLSGDFNVEQHVHYLDVCAWVMQNEYPVKAIGLGGAQVRTGPDHGHIYDHHSVVYEYAGGARLVSNCRQIRGCKNRIDGYAVGTKGEAYLTEGTPYMRSYGSDKIRKYTGEKNQMYQTEHDELFASIRSGKPINNGEYMAKSTLLAIMGRMATYTGQEITWEMALNSKEDLSPSGYDWKAQPPAAERAMPGKTKFK